MTVFLCSGHSWYLCMLGPFYKNYVSIWERIIASIAPPCLDMRTPSEVRHILVYLRNGDNNVFFYVNKY